MKIGIIMDGLGGGGAERQAVLACRELSRRGHEVLLISYGAPDYCMRFLEGFPVDVVKVTARGALRLGRIKALTEIIRNRTFDVVHCFHHPPSIHGGLAALRAGTSKLLLGYRGLSPLPFFQRIPLAWVSRRADGWVVNSSAVAKHVTNTLGARPEKIHIVHNGDFDRGPAMRAPADERRRLATMGVRPGAHLVVQVANLRPVKNIEMLYRVARRVVDAEVNAEFIVAGEGDQRAALEGLGEQMGLADRIHLIGYCEDIASLLAAADVAVLTSLTEGLPNALIESSMQGVPCVSTANGGAEDVIVEGQTGYLVPVDDDEAMADRVIRLLTDDSLRTKLGASAAAYARDTFSCQAMGDALLKAYGAPEQRSGCKQGSELQNTRHIRIQQTASNKFNSDGSTICAVPIGRGCLPHSPI